ncbi:MAG: ribonuclease, partial [Clostridia bacterium]|nr:ribonuclease [Clostridia bacterium]
MKKGTFMDTKELLSLMKKRSYRPLTVEELIEELNLEDKQSFLELLGTLEQEGYIVRTRSDRYGLPEKMGLVSGTLQASSKGF